MKEMYDIEDIIKLKVHDHVSDVPPHIWDNIQQKRSYPYSILSFLRARWRTAGLILAVVGLLWMLVDQSFSQTADSRLQTTNENKHTATSSSGNWNENDELLTANVDENTYFPSLNSDFNRREANSEFTPILPSNLFWDYLTQVNKTTNINTAKQNEIHDNSYSSISKSKENSYSSSTSKYYPPTQSFTSTQTFNSTTSRQVQEKEGEKLMDLNDEWVRATHLTKGSNQEIDYPYGPPIKYYVPIPENDYRNMQVEDLPQEMEVIPLKENILQVKDATTDRSEVAENEMAENLLKERASERILKEKEMVKDKKEKEKKKAPKKPKKNKQQWLWLDLVASPNYIIKNLSPYDNTLERNEYVNDRLRTEQSKFGYTLGLRASFRLHDVAEIRTGILYSKITENFEYQRESSIDPVTGIETTYPLEVSKNNYQFVDIPVLIGYREDRKEFDFNVNFGILLNLAFSQQGRILDPYGPGSIDVSGTPEAPIFQTRSGLALYSSVGYNYKFSDRVHLLIEPSLKYVIRPINHWDFPVRQRFHTFGMTTGLRVNIGR